MRTDNPFLRFKSACLEPTQTATHGSVNRGMCHETTIGPVSGTRGRNSRKRENHTHEESKLTCMITWFQCFSNKRSVTVGVACRKVSHCKASRHDCHPAEDAKCSERLAHRVLLKVGVSGDSSQRGWLTQMPMWRGALHSTRTCQLLLIKQQFQHLAVSGKKFLKYLVQLLSLSMHLVTSPSVLNL